MVAKAFQVCSQRSDLEQWLLGPGVTTAAEAANGQVLDPNVIGQAQARIRAVEDAGDRCARSSRPGCSRMGVLGSLAYAALT